MPSTWRPWTPTRASSLDLRPEPMSYLNDFACKGRHLKLTVVRRIRQVRRGGYFARPLNVFKNFFPAPMK
jgi:hypothetical protein